MDKLTRYQTVIKQALNNYATLLNIPHKSAPSTSTIVLAFDDEHKQYLLRELGWTEDDRIRRTILHIAIHQNKIWIEEDWTEAGIATYFLENNVPRQDIVLAFHPPETRPYTEFAVA